MGRRERGVRVFNPLPPERTLRVKGEGGRAEGETG
jgi:hypothetical protein